MLAGAVTITFIAPFVVTILGAVFLGEHVGPRRWSAIGLGFLGALVVIRPGMSAFHPAILLVMLSASLFSVRQILSRSVAGIDAPETTMCYTARESAAVASIPAVLYWQTPQMTQFLLLLFISGSAGLGEVLVIRALEIAQAAVLAPLQYTMIVWSTIFGWLVFGQFPDAPTFAGAALIIGTGVYTLHREQGRQAEP